MKAAGYIPMEIEELRGDIETRVALPPEEDEEDEEEEEQFEINYLLDSNHKIFFQDRLLTKEEKAKIISVIEIILRD